MVTQREYTGVYPGLGERRPYVQREEGGEVLYFLAPKCLLMGYKMREREPIPGLREREGVQRRLLEMLIFYDGVMTCFTFFRLSP
jgi:hypothetical protein